MLCVVVEVVGHSLIYLRVSGVLVVLDVMRDEPDVWVVTLEAEKVCEVLLRVVVEVNLVVAVLMNKTGYDVALTFGRRTLVEVAGSANVHFIDVDAVLLEVVAELFLVVHVGACREDLDVRVAALDVLQSLDHLTNRMSRLGKDVRGLELREVVVMVWLELVVVELHVRERLHAITSRVQDVDLRFGLRVRVVEQRLVHVEDVEDVALTFFEKLSELHTMP